MSEYTIDKIKYGDDKYNLKDANALRLTDANNLKIPGIIAADKGIFNKLIATDATIDTLNVDNLTAINATIVGLLDVEGDLHTNSWTAENMANIGGSFYISPTIIPTDGTTTISIIKNSTTSWSISLSGNFATDFIKSGTNTSGQNWPANSLVLITGDVTVGTIKYPLGTLKGTLSSAVTASAASTSKTITITGVTDGQGNTTPAVLNEIWNINNANISGATFSNGKISLYQLGSYPIGIQISSMGINSNSLIDIYGGVSNVPNVRIGHLGGLSSYTDSAGNSHQPTGWGIYTDNGYFKGTVIADSGVVGGFTITSSDLYNVTSDNENSVYVSVGTDLPTYSIGGHNLLTDEDSELWAFTAGKNFGVTTSGKVYATDLNALHEINGEDVVIPVDKMLYDTSINLENLNKELFDVSYRLTTDETIVEGKNYYLYDSSSQLYSIIENPTGNPQDNNYYEAEENGRILLLEEVTKNLPSIENYLKPLQNNSCFSIVDFTGGTYCGQPLEATSTALQVSLDNKYNILITPSEILLREENNILGLFNSLGLTTENSFTQNQTQMGNFIWDSSNANKLILRYNG